MTSIQYYPGYSQVVVNQNLKVRTIASITNSNPMVVTTEVDHDYPAGVIVSFLIPGVFGMKPLNGITAQVIAVTSDTLTVAVNSLDFGVFSYPSPNYAFTPPTIIPVASGPPLPPNIPLPYGNQDSFEGVIYNDGLNNGN
jgi:hypothetical protein